MLADGFIRLLESPRITEQMCQASRALQTNSMPEPWLERNYLDETLAAIIRQMSNADIAQCLKQKDLWFFFIQLYPCPQASFRFFSKREVICALSLLGNQNILVHFFEREVQNKSIIDTQDSLFFKFLREPYTFEAISRLVCDNAPYINSLYELIQHLLLKYFPVQRPRCSLEKSQAFRAWQDVYLLLAIPPILELSKHQDTFPPLMIFTHFCWISLEMSPPGKFFLEGNAGQTVLQHYICNIIESDINHLNHLLFLPTPVLLVAIRALGSNQIDAVLDFLSDRPAYSRLMYGLIIHQIFSAQSYADLGAVERATKRLNHVTWLENKFATNIYFAEIVQQAHENNELGATALEPGVDFLDQVQYVRNELQQIIDSAEDARFLKRQRRLII